ncbi:MAG TPA: DUF2752 domain-containing protein [Bacillota bacterium]
MARPSNTALFKLASWFVPPLVLMVIPTATLETGPVLCLFRILWGIRCPGCGMTRALSCVLHAHFSQAFYYNSLVVLVFPLLVLFWWRGVKRGFRRWRDLVEYERRVSD